MHNGALIDPAKVLRIAWVNLLRQVRDRSDLFFVFVLPTIIIIALGLQFGGTSSARLGIVAPAGDPSAAALRAALAADPLGFEIRDIADEATLRGLVERGRLEAGLVIPAGFDSALHDPSAGTVEVRYLGTTDALALGLQAPVQAAVSRLGVTALAARVAVGLGEGSAADAQAAAEASLPGVAGVAVEVTRIGEAGMFAGFGQFTFGASTQLILFMFLTSMTAAGKLVFTRRTGVSRRMLSTPTSAATIVAGEALGRILVALLQAAYIVAVTALAFHVAWGDPLAALLLIVLFAVVAAGVAMLAGSMASTPDQAGSAGVFIGLAAGALGGCMIPTQVMPDVMQSFSRLLPHSWALLGLQALVRDGGGVASILPNAAVLAGYGAVVMGLAAWRFRKAIAG